MSKKKFWILVGLSFVLAAIIPVSFHVFPNETQQHTISLEAKKYGYTPERIIVNKGDTVVLKPASLDATHGFLLDGYPIEFIIRKGGTYLKYTWEDDDGNLQADWDKVSEVEFIADKAGKFIFRCTQTCGNLHPFMTGELIVKPNLPYYLFVSLSIWIGFSLLIFFRYDSGAGFAAFDELTCWKPGPGSSVLSRCAVFNFW